MKTIQIDAQNMTSIEKSYSYLREQLHAPPWMGHNLDALWDMILSLNMEEPLHITLIHARALPELLGEYGLRILDLFGDLQEEGNLEIQIFW
ncbi:MAG: barstar family protein [Peptoniphilaceae bacterium]|nr:barstar family protein [Peptoniphilaceae bacterium]